jgi:hypothetical protein
MDCERFDEVVVDVLYGEVPEAEASAARQHLGRCERCAAVLANLREARKLVALPMEEPPEQLDEVVLEAARRAHRQLPWPRKIGRAVSWAGSWAMRPQLAMAALLLLMIGSSLLLLRGRPGASPMGVVRVTEQGVPERQRPERAGHTAPEMAAVPMPGESPRAAAAAPAEAVPAPERVAGASAGSERARDKGEAKSSTAAPGDQPDPSALAMRTDEAEEAALPPPRAQPASPVAAAPPAGAGANPALSYGNVAQQGAAPAPASTVPPGDAFAEAMARYRAHDYAAASRGFDAVAAAGGPNAPSAALHAARAVRSSAGCSAALPRFEAVSSRYGGASAGVQAKWEAATCYRSLGNLERTRQLLNELAAIEGQRDRAERELAELAAGANRAPAKAKGRTEPRKAAPAGKSDRKASDRGAASAY